MDLVGPQVANSTPRTRPPLPTTGYVHEPYDDKEKKGIIAKGVERELRVSEERGSVRNTYIERKQKFEVVKFARQVGREDRG